MSPDASTLTDKVRREAESRGIDIDDVRIADDVDGDGTTVRIIETDAEDEVNQVGAQVTHPGGQRGQMMFDDRLRSTLDALEEHLGIDDNSSAEIAETPDEDPRPDTTESPSTDDHDAQVRQPSESSATETRSDETDSSTTSTELDATLEVDGLDDYADRLDAVEARINELEERVETIEEIFDAVGN